MILKGKTALITGASRGIGAAVAQAYAKEGAHVVLTARTVGGLEAVDDAIQKAGGQATLIPLDMTKLEDVDKLGPALLEKFGGLDIVVGNAGMLGTLGPLTHMKPEEFEKLMTLNVTANVRLIRTLDPLLRAAPAGRAIFTSTGPNTVQGKRAYWGAYAMSKAALDAMVRSYAAENAATNIRVNGVRPGTVDTAMLRSAFPGGFEALDHVSEPEDIAPLFVELASESCQRNGEIVNFPDWSQNVQAA